jgi:hypothetical protein
MDNANAGFFNRLFQLFRSKWNLRLSEAC